MSDDIAKADDVVPEWAMDRAIEALEADGDLTVRLARLLFKTFSEGFRAGMGAHGGDGSMPLWRSP